MNHRQHKNILIEKYKSIFYSLPKNGCSAMKAHIVELIGLEKGPNFPSDVHDPEIYPYPYVNKESLNKEYKNYLRFCFVRNPWDRLVSCYKDKIKPNGFKHNEYIEGVALSLYHNSQRFYGGMPFEEFVDVVCSIPDSKAEHHHTSQLYQITDDTGNLLVNYIGNLENFEKCLYEINKTTGLPIAQIPHLRKTNRKKYQAYYSEKLIDKVRERFAADIEFFNYKFDQDSYPPPIGFIDEGFIRNISSSPLSIKILKEKNIALLSNQIQELNKRIKIQDRQLKRIRNSKSWKLTLPLRKMMSIFSNNQEKRKRVNENNLNKKITPPKDIRKAPPFYLRNIPRNREWDWWRRMKIINHFGINKLLDIGANKGQYARQIRKLGYMHSIISFEPLIDAFEKLKENALKDNKWVVNNYALGSENTKSIINVSENSGSSSLLKMLPLHLEAAPESKYIDKQEVEIKKLDDVFGHFCNEEDNVMIKIDTQGFEKEILKGGMEILNKTKIIQIEMSIANCYEGELLLQSMLNFLEKNGFDLYSLENGFADKRTGRLLQVDGLFVNNKVIGGSS